jgi:hypothetical protein
LTEAMNDLSKRRYDEFEEERRALQAFAFQS